MTEDSATRFFVGTIFVYSYVIPLALLIFYYSKIVKSVSEHEKTLHDQAKKMNVTSLRSNKDQNEKSAEVRIAKVAIALATLFVFAWTPYAFVSLTAAFGNRWDTYNARWKNVLKHIRIVIFTGPSWHRSWAWYLPAVVKGLHASILGCTQLTILVIGKISHNHLLQNESQIIYRFLPYPFSMELQKKMPWFCVHEPAPSNDDTSIGSGTTEMSGVLKETSS